MSKSIKLLAMFGFVATLSACGGSQQEDDGFVVVNPEPISQEPVYTGKYK